MSCEIKKQKIKMTRGDTLKIQISLYKNDEIYTPNEEDQIRFALKRNIINDDNSGYIDDEPLILKTVPNDTMILKLDPEDTKQLPFGTYVYDMQITFSDGSVDTFITPTEFELTPEVD